ncbi:indole-3-glycerol phosphate synthase TrpC [Paenibacillus antri]|uniref:Indole-3-glycerol phosphate synthase n=1 Tax=Paenibacillus antri TaxID=2582848 RepID=A0A5R9GI61_9BACL|nr:indole-3-glycerol phosphate synthase TrpC [Paenibacillus antri]TLS53104.1 indole-3-glycerol phosphate synthase TrpC [Paenibacillus antri]
MFLDKIVAVKKQEVERLKSSTSVAELERNIAAMPATLGFRSALVERANRPMGLIAEVKKASPSKGLIRPDFDPVAIAEAYERAGADCLSVLTDEPHFQGANSYLTAVRAAVGLPLLRKDFTIDPIHIYEARAIGADAILLIAAILSKEELRSFLSEAAGLGLDAIVEVHDREELDVALELGADLVGINNRNLKTFATDLAVTEELLRTIPKDRFVISESGLSKPEDVARVSAAGARAVLVGEHFMRQPDVAEAVAALMGEPAAR